MNLPKRSTLLTVYPDTLKKGTPTVAAASYLQLIKKWIPSDPVIHIDDSDVVKPDGYQFESLGIVRDGSESTSTKNVYKKGYHVTEACVLTSSNQSVKNLFLTLENRGIFLL